MSVPGGHVVAFWRRHWWLDVVFGLGIAASVRWWSSTGILHGGDPGFVYSAVVTASAALGTLAITPIAIVLALTPGPRLRALMDNHIDTVRRAMAWTVFANLLAIGAGIVGLVTDTATQVHGQLRVSAVGLEFAALLAMARLVWFFTAMLRVSDVDRTRQG